MRPGPKEIEDMRSIINSEKKLIGSYMVCRDHGHCSVGALLHAVGVPDQELIHVSDAETIPVEWGNRLLNRFHIDIKDTERIMATNDHDELYQKIGMQWGVDWAPREACPVITLDEEAIQERRKLVNQILDKIAADPRERTVWDRLREDSDEDEDYPEREDYDDF